MNNKPILLSSLPCAIPYIPVIRRLGYKRGAEPDGITKILIDELSKEARLLAQPKGVYKICNPSFSENTVVIEPDIMIKSKSLYKVLANSHTIIVMAVSIGKDIGLRRDYYLQESAEVTKGLILDAICSETVEAAMQALHDNIKQTGLQRGYNTTMRYSPGYNDFNLSHQADIDKLLNLKCIGVEVTDYYILNPEKSITALTGWENF
ncbi:hypothetical protein J7L67_06935 [bacterium]|nr:hypothetical protein [bacterium]